MKAIVELPTGTQLTVTPGGELGEFSVSVPNCPDIERSAAVSVDSIMVHYSPACGFKMSFVATELAAMFKGKVVEVDNGPPDPPGLVY